MSIVINERRSKCLGTQERCQVVWGWWSHRSWPALVCDCWRVCKIIPPLAKTLLPKLMLRSNKKKPSSVWALGRGSVIADGSTENTACASSGDKALGTTFRTFLNFILLGVIGRWRWVKSFGRYFAQHLWVRHVSASDERRLCAGRDAAAIVCQQNGCLSSRRCGLRNQ